MNHLLFKSWFISEMADYGFSNDARTRPRGGTTDIDGNLPLKVVNTSKIMTELFRLPAIGPNRPLRKWNDVVEYGEGYGAMRVSVSPLGSLKIITRRMSKDLLGEDVWLCQHVLPIHDDEDQDKEISIAHDLHNVVVQIGNNMNEGPQREYEDLEQLATRLWNATKKNHPSYCMFPMKLRKQNENYYKLIFEFRGHGTSVQNSNSPGRSEQFDIDLYWDEKKGLIRCWGYDIDSTIGQHSWKVQPSEWDEWFSPNQKQEQIIENVINIFMKY